MVTFAVFGRLFLTESCLHLYFRFIISLNVLLVKFPTGFCAMAQEDFGSLFLKDTGQLRSIYGDSGNYQ